MYKCIVRKYYATKEDFLDALWQFLYDIGWELWDNQGSNNYRVYRTKGSTDFSNGLYGYVKIRWDSSKLYFRAYYNWDNTNHNGTGYAFEGYRPLSDSLYAWMYGNENFFILKYKIGTNYHWFWAGFVTHKIQDVEAKLTSNASSGNNVTIEVDDTSKFKNDMNYQIVGANGEGRDKVKVVEVIDGTHLKIENLPRNYGAGSVIGFAPNTFGAGVLGSLYNPCNYFSSGTNNISYSYSKFFCYNPTLVEGKRTEYKIKILTPVYMIENAYGSSSSDSYQTYIGYLEDWLKYMLEGQDIDEEDTVAVDELDKGTSSGSNSSNTLNDTSKNWSSDEFAGKVIIITNGTGAGQIRKISSNSATQITVSEDWETIPDDTSEYVIAEKGFRKYYDRILVQEGV